MGSEAKLELRAAQLASAAVADAMHKRGVLPSYIARLHGERLAGRAVTVACGEGYGGAMLDAVGNAPAGSVLLVRGSGDWAYFGELAGVEAARRRLAGVVVDGLIRDLARLSTLPVPLFARGTTPRGALKGGPGEVQVAVDIGGVTIQPGDWVIGDADGVVVIPAAELEEVVAAAERIDAMEAEVWRRVSEGESLLDVLGGTTGAGHPVKGE